MGLWQEMIKADWPQSIIYINEAQDAVNCNFNRLGDPIFKEVTDPPPPPTGHPVLAAPATTIARVVAG